ncbi:hypothetical protein KC19_6G219500 [Ceratodon purpureus]|uniref:tRNA pseudouridine(55) synthase n=1 Tax=Ceratodon purpureus TaxID=3225 RepID=A0A8T0HK74_CERPU|nr:hypothetical protein KC19_6G219500 [Ceratodon purpureus]
MTALLLRPPLLKPSPSLSFSLSFSLSLCFHASPSCLQFTFSRALLLRTSRPRRLAPTAATAPNNSHGRDYSRNAKGNSKGDVDKHKYLLDVMAIRNQGRPTRPAPINTTSAISAKEEIQAFEKWASQKLKEEGCTVEPVLQEMRTSLIQRLTEASHVELSNAGPVELPVEKDPLAGVSVRPIVVKLRSKVPENWDGPGGTVVLIDKPQGWSSFAVCGKLRHMLGVKKVGHAGTLDPLSTGLLIVCVGKATKLADSYQAMTKVYSGTMRIGETTPSLDAGTPVSEELPWEHIEEQDMRSAVEKSFLGDIMQVPPMYSAIKVKGERLYTKARRGEEIVVPPRPVKVYDFQLKRCSHNRQEWNFYIVCSKGTYIRSLCADLALSLNSCAYLTALRREKIGGLSVEDAWPIEELETYYREVLNVPFQSYTSR